MLVAGLECLSAVSIARLAIFVAILATLLVQGTVKNGASVGVYVVRKGKVLARAIDKDKTAGNSVATGTTFDFTKGTKYSLFGCTVFKGDPQRCDKVSIFG